MLSLTEIKAMEDALKAFDAYVARLKQEHDRTSFLASLGNSEYKKLGESIKQNLANRARFIDRRNQLIEDGNDHEGVSAFVSSLRKIAGSPLPKLYEKSIESNSPVNTAVNVAKDTAKDVAGALKIGIPTLIAVAIVAVVILEWPQVSKILAKVKR